MGLMVAACGPTSSGGASSQSSQKGTVTVFISGDTNVQDLWEKGLIPAFNKQYPNISVKTEIDLHGEHDQQTVAKLATSTKAGDDPGYQLVDAGWVTGQAAKANLLDKVSTSDISNLADVPADTVSMGQGVGIPYRASSVLLAYDSTKVKNPPKTLAALLQWIVDNPGQFAYNSPSTGGSGGAFVNTVLDSHLTKGQQDVLRLKKDASAEAAWKEGFAKLASLNPYVYQKGVYPNGNNQVLSLLGQGSIEMAPVWSDQFITAQKTGDHSRHCQVCADIWPLLHRQRILSRHSQDGKQQKERPHAGELRAEHSRSESHCGRGLRIPRHLAGQDGQIGGREVQGCRYLRVARRILFRGQLRYE
jgi:putative spermidine/putrescine transport system substrate-binding protein